MLQLLGYKGDELPDVQTLLSRLPAQWIAAWETRHRMQNTVGARQSLTGLALLSCAVCEGTLCYEDSGRPSLAGADVDFSITHTDGLVLCAVARSDKGIPPRVGVDAESVNRTRSLPVEKLVARWFTEREQAQYRLAPSAEQFTRIWTRKEALVKYRGTGLSALHTADTVATEKSGIRFTEYRVESVIVTVCHSEKISPTQISFHVI